jgi:hypothetical protein
VATKGSVDLKTINLTDPRYSHPLKVKFVPPRVPGSLTCNFRDIINGKDTISGGSLKKNEPEGPKAFGFKILRTSIGVLNHNSESVRNNIRNNERLMKGMITSGGLTRLVATKNDE